jgi:hypothetical protein
MSRQTLRRSPYSMLLCESAGNFLGGEKLSLKAATRYDLGATSTGGN